MLKKRIPVFLALFACITSGITYWYITQKSSAENISYVTITLFLLTFALFLSAVIFAARHVFHVWANKKSKRPFSTLQTKILSLFSIISAFPALIIIVFSTFFFQFVIESWFNKQISTALDESVSVAEAYLKEHENTIKVRAKAMATELDNNIIKYNLHKNPQLFTNILTSLAELNTVSEAVVFYNNHPVVKSRLGTSLSLEAFDISLYEKAHLAEVVLVPNAQNKIRAMAALHSIPNAFLVVGRYIDTKILEHAQRSHGAAQQYKNLKDQILKTQISFLLAFFTISLLILVGAIYAGISFADTITQPIQKLVLATLKVQSGDFSTKVDEYKKDDEIGALSRAFNVMISFISKQKAQLVNAYEEINEKRKFSEAVLSGISTGIIVISDQHTVRLVNDSASKLLETNKSSVLDKHIQELIPEISGPLSDFKNSDSKVLNLQIQTRKRYKILSLYITVSKEITAKKIRNYIIAFDDMTELVAAQKYAAWSDVARKIAHEVKNPLTPIHLSAERLKIKYSKEVSDKENFEKYTNVIINHVEDIRRIIDEFALFARLPSPKLEVVDLEGLINALIFSRKCASPNIKYVFEVMQQPQALCDPGQINQVMTNILKNAEEAIEHKSIPNGAIKITLAQENNTAVMNIVDNAKALDEKLINKILDPYFTTKPKGTGLGLAIAKKIIDDHNGRFIIKATGDKSANVVIELPVAMKEVLLH